MEGEFLFEKQNFVVSRNAQKISITQKYDLRVY